MTHNSQCDVTQCHKTLHLVNLIWLQQSTITNEHVEMLMSPFKMLHFNNIFHIRLKTKKYLNTLNTDRYTQKNYLSTV